MRVAILSILAVVFVCSAAFAQEAPRGVLPSNKKSDIFDSTPEQIDEALKISFQCKNGEYLRTYYDCDCLGMKFLELRKERGEHIAATPLLIEAQKLCPNSADVAGRTLGQCTVWSRTMRPYNYEEFCNCFASEFAKQYQRNTSDNPYVREAQMTNAYIKCDKGQQLNERLDKQKDIERLKKEGMYEKMFPLPSDNR